MTNLFQLFSALLCTSWFCCSSYFFSFFSASHYFHSFFSILLNCCTFLDSLVSFTSLFHGSATLTLKLFLLTSVLAYLWTRFSGSAACLVPASVILTVSSNPLAYNASIESPWIYRMQLCLMLVVVGSGWESNYSPVLCSFHWLFTGESWASMPGRRYSWWRPHCGQRPCMDRPTAGSARTWPTPHTGSTVVGLNLLAVFWIRIRIDFGWLDLNPVPGHC